jgi:glycosyltransferase involved in cell wall biosynthesis
MTRLSIIVASSGRPTLSRTVESIVTQMQPGDELLVDVNNDAPWGHAARNRLMPRATGDFLLFLDDDDAYLPYAFDAVRSAIGQNPGRIHMFRMRYPDERELWSTQKIECGNVSTQMVVVPNKTNLLGQWGGRYEGDFDFIASTCSQMGEPVWCGETITLVRPA